MIGSPTRIRRVIAGSAPKRARRSAAIAIDAIVVPAAI